MSQENRLTKDIHNFVRGRISWEESMKLLDEIIELKEWMKHLEIDMQLYEMGRDYQGLNRNNPPIPELF